MSKIKVDNQSLREIIKERLSNNQKVLDVSDLDTSTVTDMSDLFVRCKLNKIVGLDKWDTSNVTTMQSMFFYSKITELKGMEDWNVNNVTNMCELFKTSKIEVMSNISNWNVSNVCTMEKMFSYSEIKDIGDISNWDISKVKNTVHMFDECVLGSQFVVEDNKIVKIQIAAVSGKDTGVFEPEKAFGKSSKNTALNLTEQYVYSLMTTSQKQKYGETPEGIKQFCKERLNK